MSDDATPLYILGIGDGSLDESEIEIIRDAVADVLGGELDDGGLVIINQPVEAITRDDLKEIIADE